MPGAVWTYDLWNTPIGFLGLAMRNGRVGRIEIDAREDNLVRDLTSDGGSAPARDPSAIGPFRSAIDRYLAGRGNLNLPIEEPRGTSFQRQVWECLRSIPPGQVRSYGWLARCVGRDRAVRAVGQANGSNPLPLVIPCHRVVQSTGRLGGYAGDRTWIKAWLLRLEGCPIEERGGTYWVPAQHLQEEPQAHPAAREVYASAAGM
jgi:methylated-DNA-[protein]-cysteine S-methyltransferase